MSLESDQCSEHRVDLDVMFSSLGHATRRRILAELVTDSPCWSHEFEVGPAPSNETGWASSEVALNHVALPRLEEEGFVDWDRTSGRITRGENFAEIVPLLQFLDEYQAELSDD